MNNAIIIVQSKDKTSVLDQSRTLKSPSNNSHPPTFFKGVPGKLESRNKRRQRN